MKEKIDSNSRSLKWEKVKLKDGDNLEIVSIVGGG